MSKTNVLLYLLMLSCISSITTTHPLKDLFKGREWEFMEDEFITKPNRELTGFLQTMKRWVPSLTAGIFGAAATDYLAINYTPKTYHDIKTLQAARFFGTPSGGVLCALGTYKLISESIEARVYFKALEIFIRAWPENRSLTPMSLQSGFDSLYEIYSLSGNYGLENLAQETIRLTHLAIYQHFPHKYGHKIQSQDKPFFHKSFFHAIVTCDISQLIRAIVDLGSIFMVKDN